MGSQQELVLIDTNIFVIDLRYKRDIHYGKNLEFLTTIAQRGTGFTTLVNLLELCGILSFNLNEKQLLELWSYFQTRYKITVLPPADMEAEFPTCTTGDLFELIKKKTSLGDALMMAIAKNHLSFVSMMVTWDKDHFNDKFPGVVVTPDQYLSSESDNPHTI